MSKKLQSKLEQLAHRVADRILTPENRKENEPALTDAIDALKALTTTYATLRKNQSKPSETEDANELSFATFQAALEEPNGQAPI